MTSRYSNDKWDKKWARHRRTSEETAASYKRWRASIPYSDEEIAKAMEEAALASTHGFQRNNALYYAKLIRWRGVVSAKSLRVALPFLVKICAVCGAKALYRQGNYGRCREHREVPEYEVLQRTRRLDERSKEIGQARVEFDRLDLQRRGIRRSDKTKA